MSYRSVDDQFWEDPYVETLSGDERLLYLCLLTNPRGNIAGVFEMTPAQMKRYAVIDDARLEAILKKFEADKKVFRWETYVILKNWPKHQALDNAKIQKGIERVLSSLSSELLAYIASIGYTYPGIREYVEGMIQLRGDTVSIPYAYPIDRVSPKKDSPPITVLNCTVLNGKALPSLVHENVHKPVEKDDIDSQHKKQVFNAMESLRRRLTGEQ
jgi:hypothetical protein